MIRFSSLLLALLLLGMNPKTAFGFGGAAPREEISIRESVPAPVITSLQNTFALIRDLRGTASSRLHDGIFGAIDGQNYLRFVSERIEEIAYEPIPHSNTQVAFVRGAEPTVLYITSNTDASRVPLIYFLDVLVHEARHAEHGVLSYAHVSCPIPFVDFEGNEVRGIITGNPIAGRRACDTTADGPYGIVATLMKNIEHQCETCTEKVRMDAKLFGDDDARRVIDRSSYNELREDIRQAFFPTLHFAEFSRKPEIDSTLAGRDSF